MTLANPSRLGQNPSMKLYLMTCLMMLVGTIALASTNELDHETSPRPSTNRASVMIIPVEGMIERGLSYVMRRAIDRARESNVSALVLDMNTPGGRVDVTEDLMRMLSGLPDTITTYTLVNPDALSAGALLSIATDRIYMTPGSRIGASAIVSATGDIEEGDLKEKHVSALVALARSISQANGHDPDVIEAMIRKDMEFKIGDEIIVEAGQLLTLTDSDAAMLVGTNDVKHPLLSKGTVDSIDALLAAEGLEKANVTTVSLSPAEKLARFIELYAFIFLAGGLLGIYVEFKTPGFGFPGITGGILLAIFFWGHRIAGLSGDIELFIFIIGALLLILELLVIPGFGLPGFAGITLMLIALFMSMTIPIPGGPWFQFPTLNLHQAFMNLGLSMVLVAVFGALAGHFLPNIPAFQQLILSTSIHEATPSAADQSNASATTQIGDTGETLTPLHPAGTARIKGQRLSVVAAGDFIEAHQPIRVSDIHGNRIVVTANTQPTPSSGDPA